MKGFATDETGDVLIVDNEIVMISGDSLLQQKVKNVISTNMGEWFLDWDEGIDFGNLLGKGTTEEMAKYEIERGLKQVDSTLEIASFTRDVDTRTRKATVTFEAKTENGETVGGEYVWG